MIQSRRALLSGLAAAIVAPAIVRPASIMPVKRVPVIDLSKVQIDAEDIMYASGGYIYTDNGDVWAWIAPGTTYREGGHLVIDR